MLESLNEKRKECRCCCLTRVFLFLSLCFCRSLWFIGHIWTTTMKLNLSYPPNGTQKLIDIDDEKKVRIFYDKRIGAEVAMDSIGEEWKGYVVRITGGNDKQGFPMKQGVLTTSRVRLLLSAGHSCYRPRRSGERKRKSVRGCIVDANLSVLALVIVVKGELLC